MNAQDGYTREDWTRLFVESIQAERRTREEQTTDTQRSVEAYTLAAERKINEALRSAADSALLSHRTTSVVVTRPRNGPR